MISKSQNICSATVVKFISHTKLFSELKTFLFQVTMRCVKALERWYHKSRSRLVLDHKGESFLVR